jgi:peptidoglycan/xylan/chitin deacetylase (PgdA/CDA1 family)
MTHQSPVVIFGFDMETDIGSWTPFYEGLVHGTPRILDVLDAQGVRGTFFFVGDAARQHPSVVQMVDHAGHEVGCHTLYHETIGEELFPIPGLRPVLPEECFHRIEVATAAVREALGYTPVSFRAPRLWGSTAMVNALEDLGYIADATYPLYYYAQRLTPYHPCRADWTQEGDMRILEIPNFADMTLESSDPFGRDRDQWPIFRTESAEALMRHVDNMLGYLTQRQLPAVICLYLHPWEFLAMPEGLIHFGEGSVLPDPFIIKNCGDYAVAQLDALITLLKQRGARFLTCAALAEEYAAAGQAV